MLDAYRILHYLCVRNQITNTAMAKTIICPYCGHSDYYAYQPYKGDGRNGKTEYHCNECETDFFEGDEYENKVTQMNGFVMIEMVQTKSGN